MVAISNREKFAMIEQPSRELSLEEIISRLPEVDLVLTEGYKKNDRPKIEIHRAELNRPLIAEPGELLAVMTDAPLPVSVPQLPLTDAAGCADLILGYLRRYRGEAEG